jgi:hypothetical protein
MRVTYDRSAARPMGYTLWLSADDTYNWATRPHKSCPCSTLRGSRLVVQVDSNGLCDIAIDGKLGDCDGTELDAIVSDHLPPALRHLWPVWENPGVAVNADLCEHDTNGQA